MHMYYKHHMFWLFDPAITWEYTWIYTSNDIKIYINTQSHALKYYVQLQNIGNYQVSKCRPLVEKTTVYTQMGNPASIRKTKGDLYKLHGESFSRYISVNRAK